MKSHTSVKLQCLAASQRQQSVKHEWSTNQEDSFSLCCYCLFSRALRDILDILCHF